MTKTAIPSTPAMPRMEYRNQIQMATCSGQYQMTNKKSRPSPMFPRSVDMKLLMRPTRLDGVEVEETAGLSAGVAGTGEIEAAGGGSFCLDFVWVDEEVPLVLPWRVSSVTPASLVAPLLRSVVVRSGAGVPTAVFPSEGVAFFSTAIGVSSFMRTRKAWWKTS